VTWSNIITVSTWEVSHHQGTLLYPSCPCRVQALEIIYDLRIGFPINNIISLSVHVRAVPVFLKAEIWCHTHLALCTCCVCFSKNMMTMRKRFSRLWYRSPYGRACGKRRGFSHGAAARHSQSARGHTRFYFNFLSLFLFLQTGREMIFSCPVLEEIKSCPILEKKSCLVLFFFALLSGGNFF